MRVIATHLRFVLVTVATAAAASAATAQLPADSLGLTFATASVRPALALDLEGRRGIRLHPGGVFSATAVTLRELIAFAYQRHPFDKREIVGPPWLDSARFDIQATVGDEHRIDPDGAARRTWAMLRTLLRSRFRLRIEEETRSQPIYLLTRARADGQLGPRIKSTTVDCGALMRGEAQPSTERDGPPCSMKKPPGRLFANTVIMSTLASMLSEHLDRPVIDSTGVTGRFDVQLEATEILAAPGYRPGPSDLALPPAEQIPIRVAVRKQLGLSLEHRIAAVSVLVVRHAVRTLPD